MTPWCGLLMAFLLMWTLLMCSAERSGRSKRDAEEDDLCQVPPNPSNGKYECSSDFFYKICTATCNEGYEFSSKEDSFEHQCEMVSGTWFSGPEVPECIPKCSSPCQHGGTCSAPNVCSCTEGYTGPQCQQRAEVCPRPPNPRFGQITCTTQGEDVVCTVTCSPKFIFETDPAPEYRCSADGTWTPAKDSIPNCVQDFDSIDTTPSSGLLPTGSTVHPTVPTGAMCTVWGQEHYRTFDNNVYTFIGSCEYQLVRDCALNTFSVNVINDRHCDSNATCKRELDLYLGSSKVSLRQTANGLQVTWDGTPHSVPFSRSGTVFQQVGNYLTVQSPLGFLIKWDGKESIFFRASADLKTKTCGLCGNYDGDPSNDFTTASGSVVTSAAAFGSSWKKTTVGAAPCPDAAQAQTCDAARSHRADLRCGQILNDNAFKACHATIDPNMFVEACKFDCCALDSNACTCKSMEAYSRACMDAGIRFAWRRNNRCPIRCEGGKIFHECGSPCIQTCNSPSHACTDQTCVDGCFCPQDTVENNGQCVPVDQCPCTFGNQTYSSGQTMQQDCNTCTCGAGKWTCTTKKCEATCSATGDPHYQTFDGTRFDFMGKCSYYLIHDKDFEIIVDNIECGHDDAACTKSLSININGQSIKMDHNHQLFVNGREVTSLPYEIPGLKIYMVSSLFMKAEFSNGIYVLWDGRTRAYVTVPPSFRGQTAGLCGTFDGIQNNDMLTPQGVSETNPNAFGNSWKTETRCADMPLVTPPNPCDSNPQRKQQAQEMCSKLKSSVFSLCPLYVTLDNPLYAACHDVEDVEGYFDDCMYDMCACTENLKDCLCPTLGIYADTCASKGVKINWRFQIPDCMLECPGGQTYQVCGNPCERTCRNIANGDTCQADCVEGCNCPDGQTLNDEGVCVDIAQCPCIFDGRQLAAGTTTLKGAEICQCTAAQWACSQLTFDNPLPTSLTPICQENSEYMECASNCPRTCENMNEESVTCDVTGCKAGCACLEGFVLEGNRCINASSCPCHHGGETYQEGDVIAMDCNQCTCRSRKWVCEQNACPSVCSAVGDSHYTTFDGRDYQFQGNCDYVLVRSKDGSDTPFQVTTENVACGTSGVTCSRTIQITVGESGTPSFYTLQLIRGQSVKPDPGSPFTVREVGEFVYIDTPFGLSIQWDKGTRVYVRLTTDHREKVEGLCGNFNGIQKDDFTTPQGGMPVVKATEFGDSWKLHSYCAPSLEVTDTCLRTPQRKTWAQKQCDILTSDLFQPCHVVEDPTKYKDRCVFDACACNSGGDCECLCTAIAAYAHVCATKGRLINWRSKDLCPIQCEQCEAYNPCISTCPKKTCDNLLNYAELAGDCQKTQDVCLEGCDFKPCPRGQVYSSLEKPHTCIPEALCNTPACKINGKTYREGERIHDDEACNHACEICNCRNGDIEHISYGPCTALVPTPSTAPERRRVPSQNIPAVRTKAACSPSETFDTCAYTCDDVCDFVGRSAGCSSANTGACLPGCRNTNDTRTIDCPPGEKRVDANTCVPASMCSCLKPDGTMAKPFETWKNPEDSCSDCSCYNGAALCTLHDPACTAAPSGQPTPGPATLPVCGWSAWMNSDKPTSGSGDVESLASLKHNHGFCANPLQIECRNADTREAVSIGSKVTCNIQSGLTCNNADFGGACADYEIRVYCPCNGNGTTSPDHSSPTPTPSPRGECTSRWSEWINRDDPHSGAGDNERLTLEELTTFCPGGRITDIECKTINDIEYYSSGETLTCTVETGLICLNTDNDPIGCNDYQIRYKCSCAPSITRDEEPTNSPQRKEPLKCGWTEWMSGHTSNDAGEQEKISSLRSQFTFCPSEDITAVECRPVGAQHVDGDLGDPSVCDIKYDGYLCRTEDLHEGHTCADYEVRFLCEPRYVDCSQNTPTPSPADLVTPVVPATPSGKQFENIREPIYTVCADSMKGEAPLDVTDSQLRASSSLSLFTSPSRSRVSTPQEGVQAGGWLPKVNDNNQWLEIFFSRPMTVAGLVTQGRDGYPQWVTQYKLMYSLDGIVYHNYEERPGVAKVFDANTDSSTQVRQMLQPITARFFVVQPVAWHGSIALRVSLLGCRASAVPTAVPIAQPFLKPTAMPTADIPVVCTEEMGMMAGKIRDDMLSASSSRDAAHSPQTARLGGNGSWMPSRDDVSQHLQIDLLTPHYVTGVTTQGHATAPLYVKNFRVLYSTDGVNWNVYQEVKGVDKMFESNRDSMTPVTSMFQHPIRARYIRINPLSWEGRIALRIELHGCFEDYPAAPTSATPTAAPTARFTPTPSTNVPDGCIKWDAWVDTHQPGLTSRDDFEPIDKVREISRTCRDPLTIQCRTATADHTMSDATGQSVRCNLWDGLLCLAADIKEQSCFNYEVRLGCVRQTADCLSQVPTAVPTAQPTAHPTSSAIPCYSGLDMTSCPPSCPTGQYCDGATCVTRSECPCLVDGKMLRARDVATNGNCETCQCLNGETRCLAKTCATCSQGMALLNKNTCRCECRTCSDSEFQCGNGQCLPLTAKCDGVIDCQEDELNCLTRPTFIPPSLTPVSGGKATPSARPDSLLVLTPSPLPRDNTSCPAVCPKYSFPSCPEGNQVVEIISDCSCTRKACMITPLPATTPVPTAVCRHQDGGQTEKLYNVGDTWSEGPCVNCTCIFGNSGAAEVSCLRQECSACKEGEVRVNSPNQCCGSCQVPGCLFNGTVYKAGQPMPSSRPCYTKSCERDSKKIGYVIQETRVRCKPLDEVRRCFNDEPTYDESGCCLTCAPRHLVGNATDLTCSTCSPQPTFASPDDTIGHVQVHKSDGVLCINAVPLTGLQLCQGQCGASDDTCSCCRPTVTTRRHVPLRCDDGSSMKHSYSVVHACQCGACGGE